MTRPCCSSGCGKLMIAWRQHGMSTLPSSPCSSAATMSSSPSPYSPYLRASSTGTRLTCDTRESASLIFSADDRSSANVDPFVGVVLELRDGRVLEARLDRQEPDRRRARRVVQELGRAHRRAARRSTGRSRCAEVGEEDRVDELRLAARELGDEGDDELVLVQPLEQLLDAQVDLRVGQVLLRSQSCSVGTPRATAGVASRCRPRSGPRDRGTGP